MGGLAKVAFLAGRRQDAVTVEAERPEPVPAVA